MIQGWLGSEFFFFISLINHCYEYNDKHYRNPDVDLDGHLQFAHLDTPEQLKFKCLAQGPNSDSMVALRFELTALRSEA